ncbi:MAG TPA: glycine C-acetyltransferase [Gemmatales bacterium]|nr:glycine C-acetyltransferase [Gemmatales bacterium]HMP58046.1 glycine C-acetyltransferase [Gemmatales bacterium]
MDAPLLNAVSATLESIRAAGTWKSERLIISPQGADIEVAQRGHVINFCANNYMGLANHPGIVAAAIDGLKHYGMGMASVRFICGTQTPHKQLEAVIAKFYGKDDAILYNSCFDANGGLFETLLGEQDAVISDELNHASIIDGIRLCKARRFRYKHADMADLARCLVEAGDARIKLIATDGVFSMDGDIAPLADICTLADQHQAAVMIDDCHATGFLGATGRGSLEECGVMERIDIITSTIGKTLSGSVGGYTVARGDVVELLRQRSRPYLFSNALPPAVAVAALKALELIDQGGELRARLHENAQKMRAGLTQAGFTLKPGRHPIMPIMLYDARVASTMADKLLERGIYVIGFSYPVVPHGQARIRMQMSAAHTPAHLDRALEAFIDVGRELGVIPK